MPTLICGSVAYDTIMVFPDRFDRHILPHKVHMLSVSFLVPEMRREFGGCAGNIAYNLKMLGGEPIVMAAVGQDFTPYAARFDQLGIRRDCVKQFDQYFTPQCYITTDLDDNQINAFHPGAMSYAHENSFAAVRPELHYAIVGPDGLDGMLNNCRELAKAGVPYIFDPGQGTPLFSGEQLIECISASTAVAMNDYEAELVHQKTGKTLSELAKMTKVLVVTLGGDGSNIYVDGKELRIPSAPPKAIVDPTGCGDAYRAGLLFGMEKGWTWDVTGRLASLLGAVKIASKGGQNHHFDRASLSAEYRAAFGTDLPAW
ncbi:carbohydrate kinase family protein [Chitinimonas sp. BJB300]|uniref:carbohydrate kinase family protein n=1 Tax=Chitinimonas sp. BJB300 TaxID=1559339 RepID=UPI000C0F452E|nr:carbohydrate kinase family protein [Chitinimonas sp. BJB300]PHV10576.1 carbohydrate kinase family protein [Chitinimonas sp. BJB300]TSJ91050.1 carbohydrate kinase family protein [Chitinimonas sp. BJB300]